MAITLQEIRQKYPQYDSKSDEELADAIHSKYYPALPKAQIYDKLGLSLKPEEPEVVAEQPERTGLLGVGSDIAHGLSGAAKFALDIPNKLEKSGQYIEEHPGSSILHNAGQLAAGAGELGKGLLNAPHDLLKYFIKKHLAVDIPIPGTKLHTSDLIPHLPEDMGIEKALGLEADKEKGDDLFRAIPEIAAGVTGGVGLAKGIKKLATAPSKERAFQRALESQINKAAEETGLAEGDLNKLKESLELEYSKLHPNSVGELSPIGQQVQINKKQLKLEKNPQKNNIPEGELPIIPEAPDTKGMLERHQQVIDEAKEAAESDIGILSNPKLGARQKIKTAINDVKSSASELYQAGRNHYRDKKISVDNSAEIKAATKELEAMKDADELAPGYGSGTADQKALESQIEALKGETVNASDIFDLQRTLETMAENTREKQFAGKVPELEYKRLGNIASRLDAHADSLAKRLESVGGKDVQKIITEANKGWRIYKQLSLQNPVGKGAMYGEIPNQALIKIADEHPANDFMKALIDSDPELKKQLLAAYVGEGSVKKLLRPSKVIKSYIESLPEVEEKLTAFKNAVADYKAGEKSAAKIDKTHEDLVKSMKEAAEAKHLQQQIKFHEEAIPKIETKMSKVDVKSAEHAKLEKQLKDHKQHLADKNHLLKKYGKRFIGFLAASEVSHKLGF